MTDITEEEYDTSVTPYRSILAATGLVKNYGRVKAVRDISVSVEQGRIVGLLGPNGAGKTTSFYAIAGFIHPTAGKITIDGEDITRLPMYKRALKGIAYLPQDASVFRSLTVEENILSVLEFRKNMSKKEQLIFAESLMDELGITPQAKQRASTLSGGQRRRTEIARALAVNPRFLLLDEPFSGVDPITVHEIKTIVRTLAREKGIGILITDHNVRDTLEITDHSYICNLGEVLISGSHEELVNSKIAKKIYLGDNFRL